MRSFIAVFFSALLFLNCSGGEAVKDSSGKKIISNDTLYLAGGCFWCVEAIYEQLKGVSCVESGYANCIRKGKIDYDAVCSGNTGCAEVVKICFDSTVVQYPTLLSVFFKTHDPTTLNRQGYDRGTQYRSGIYHNEEEKRKQAFLLIDSLNQAGVYDNPIVTEVMPLYNFYLAENYHQNYYKKNPENRYCQKVIQPKEEKFRKVFSWYLKDTIKIK